MLSSSFLGPFFIIFGLRISLTALQDKEERDWVVAKLFEIGDTHMAMASRKCPSRALGPVRLFSNANLEQTFRGLKPALTCHVSGQLYQAHTRKALS